jgi:hypothetical protein
MWTLMTCQKMEMSVNGSGTATGVGSESGHWRTVSRSYAAEADTAQPCSHPYCTYIVFTFSLWVVCFPSNTR